MKSFILYLLILFCAISFAQKPVFAEKRVNDSIVFIDVISTTVAGLRIEVIPRTKANPNIKFKEKVFLPSMDTIYGIVSYPEELEDKKPLEYFEIKHFWDSENEVIHNDDYLYLFPFRKGKKYKVSQSFNGKNSHRSIASKYAIDFVMPIGDKVYAARSGKVIYTINHFKESGGEEYVHKANKIVILHDDGTYGNYAHLDFKGTLVEAGDIVERGQHIGYSGNTGKTRGPHLHFVVRKPDDTSVQIQFEGYEGKVLKKGKRYKR